MYIEKSELEEDGETSRQILPSSVESIVSLSLLLIAIAVLAWWN
jgi:hypothetical protein